MDQERPVTVVVEAKLRHGVKNLFGKRKEIAISYCMHRTVTSNELEECERRLKDMNRTKGACCEVANCFLCDGKCATR